MKVFARNLLVMAALFGSIALLLLSHANLQLRKSASISTASGTTEIRLHLQNRISNHGFSFMKSGSVKHVGSRPNSNWEWSFGVHVDAPESSPFNAS
jgi:hypothetical protein